MPRSNHGLWNWLGCSTLLAVGCQHTQPQPAPFAPPPGWASAPVTPAAPGCSSCGPSTNPAVTAPRYTPPFAAPPPITSYPSGGITLGTPIHAHTPEAITQTSFRPPPLDARLGAAVLDEGAPIPLPPPPADETPSLVTKR